VDIAPIIKALRRNKLGTLLMCLQITMTLAIVCNCLSVIDRYMERSTRPTGIDEGNIFTLSNQWLGNPADIGARIQADLAAIRSVPAVRDVQDTNSFPLRGGGWGWKLSLRASQKVPTSSTTLYFVDDHGLNTYGLMLVAGRWFRPDEIGEHGMSDLSFPPTVVISADLAHRLFPSGNAVGQMVYWTPTATSRIVGIVERAQTPWAAFMGRTDEQSSFLPYRYVDGQTFYVVRARPGQLADAMRKVPEQLIALSQERIVDNISTFTETRNTAYFESRTNAVELGALSGLLLGVTGCGIVGLTVYWVNQRRRQIGVRRALGASAADILIYFHAENLLIAGCGTVLGVALALASNLWLVTHFELARVSVGFVALAALIVLAASQVAVFWPSLQAASISPASAARGQVRRGTQILGSRR